MRSDGVWSVTGLNEYVAAMLAGDARLTDVRVRGEISGFKRHTSGHLYFSIKDENALVRCVMFRQQAMRLSFSPRDGMQVVLTGAASLYTKDGAFQLYARALEQSGDGALYQRFLEWKDKLERAGYFDEAHKRPIPFLPACVGVVTSATGAALHDILQIIERRFPKMNVLIAPASVQGVGAAEEIASAIRRMNEAGEADVLIVGRGGGSMEDLWAFNEPAVAKAIYESEIPVISAVGHETDFTIADFVADLRAPTPSAAAELAVPEYEACKEAALALSARCMRALSRGLSERKQHVQAVSGGRAFLLLEQRLSTLLQTVDRDAERAAHAVANRIAACRGALKEATARLQAISPLAVLQRGYALVTDGDGHAVSSVRSLSVGTRIGITLPDGGASAEITGISERGDRA